MNRKIVIDVLTVALTLVVALALTVFLESLDVGLIGFVGLAVLLSLAVRYLSGMSLLDD